MSEENVVNARRGVDAFNQRDALKAVGLEE
jgi:hypothetical protein